MAATARFFQRKCVFMQSEKPIHDPEGSTIMFGWFFLATVVVVLFWLASSRLHLTPSELTEIALLGAVGLYLVVDVATYFRRRSARRVAIWPPPKPRISFGVEAQEVDCASDAASVLLGHESDGKPVFWDNETRSWQTITSGMSGSGKTTLIESILQQDINRGVPIIFVDGKGEKKLLDRILPIVEAAGRMDEAIDICRQALRCEPDLVDAYTRLAHLLAAEGLHASALSHARVAVALAPDDANAVAVQALALSRIEVTD